MSLPPLGTPVPAIAGPARRELRLALLEAFPQPSELSMLVEETLGEPFVNISLANDMPTRTFDLDRLGEGPGAADRTGRRRMQPPSGRRAPVCNRSPPASPSPQ